MNTMDLQEKLKYYRQETKPAPAAEPRISELCRQLEAELVDQNAAPVIKIERFYTYSHFIPGLDQLSQQEIQIPLLSLDQFPENIPLDRVLIFDLETTGLAGGAGTYPFLLGFADFKPTGLRTVQYFLPDFGRESIAFLAIQGLIQDKKILLSYNGKSYDYPLLKNRYILNRMDNPFSDFDHLDLLHVARRAWKGSLNSCSLESIEREIFLFSRLGDIGGWMIPQAYFDYIRSGVTDDIIRVIHHNIFDLLSLARLCLHLHHVENISASDNEILRLLQLAVKRHQISLVETFLTELKNRKRAVPEHIMADYSLLLKRERHWEPAIQIWNRLVQSRDHVLFAHLELAKYYEHTSRDLPKAENHTERAIQFIQTIRQLRDEPVFSIDEQDLHKRLERIRRKAVHQVSS